MIGEPFRTAVAPLRLENCGLARKAAETFALGAVGGLGAAILRRRLLKAFGRGESRTPEPPEYPHQTGSLVADSRCEDGLT